MTTGTILLAVAATLSSVANDTVTAYACTERVWDGEVWRFITCTLPHLGFFHLFFNIYWTWMFGSFVEQVHGSNKALAMLLFLAIGSSLGSYGFYENGVGLSGVGYGLFGFLWIAQRKDSRFRGAVSPPIVILFIFWFFLCILLTWLSVFPVANFAHGTGWLLGIGLAYAVGDLSRHRLPFRIGLGAVMIVFLVLTLFRGPYLNISDTAGNFYARQATGAHELEDYSRSVRLFEKAVDADGPASGWLYLWGQGLVKLDRPREAVAVYDRLLALDENNFHHRNTIFTFFRELGVEEARRDRFAEAASLFKRALEIFPNDDDTWYRYGLTLAKLDRRPEARAALEKAVKLNARSQSYRDALADLSSGEEKGEGEPRSGD